MIIPTMGLTYCCRLLAAIVLIDIIFVSSLVKGEYRYSVQSTAPKSSLSKIIPETKKKSIKPKSIELHGGGTKIFPTKTLVALYGTPNNPALGVLGEQDVQASIDRAKALAASYQPFTTMKVLPSFEIITTIASSEATENNDYSREVDFVVLEQWIKEAEKAGVYVVLDLQPGHSDFLSQAKQIEHLLEYPNVGLALDPEWRLKPGMMHMIDIGTVDAVEVNHTAAWLAEFTKQNKLPQKVFLLHQFRLDMITNASMLKTNYPELAYMIQMDGHGEQSTKQDTWSVVTANYNEGVSFGWKNFIDEDIPMLTPEQTMLKMPSPRFISYQ